MAKRELTEKQQLFLDVLFEEAEGDPLKVWQLLRTLWTVLASLRLRRLKSLLLNLSLSFQPNGLHPTKTKA